MSTQLGAAARYVLGRPRDVALLSIREQARQAGVQPITMTRFARHLGIEGCDRVREVCAAAVRDGDLGFAGKADAHVASRRFKGDRAMRQDPLVVTSVLPETHLTVELAECARGAALHRRTRRGARHPPQAAIRDENLTART
jgi:DNA-binding MurR/RpiR family transcriptional regulator